MITPQSYRSYRDLPPVAGICTMPEAAVIGFSVDECVARLKRHHWSMKRLHEILIARIPSEPIYEIKMGFSLHAHYCAEHAAAWRKRVGEMREPPLGLDHPPHPRWMSTLTRSPAPRTPRRCSSASTSRRCRR
jgi:hypothetical protein